MVWLAWYGSETVPPTDTSVFSNNNMFSCPHVFKTKTCSHVLLSFQQQHVLMFSCLQKKHVLLFSCLKKNMFSCSLVFQKQHVLLSFPKKNHVLPSNYVFMSPKKNGWEQRSQPLSLELCLLFSKADSLLRTYACACTALCAEIRVDRILFAFWDCLYWALANTCTACDAVVTNYVSHN